MNYRAVGKRCAVVLESLHLPISHDAALGILAQKGFTIQHVNLVATARACIGTSEYRRGVRVEHAPTIVDCSSFIKWLFGLRGIYMPRLAIQQYACGEAVEMFELQENDLVFTSGPVDFYHSNPAEGIGHVGLVTKEGTVIHAANKRKGIEEIPVADFIGKKKFRGARRNFPSAASVLTLEIPETFDVETSDDIRYLILSDKSLN